EAAAKDAALADTGPSADAAGLRDAAVGPGPNVTLNPFTDTYVYGNHDGGSMRSFDTMVTFPPMPSTYRTINLKIVLRCPTAAPRSCNYVDQRGFVGVVQKTANGENVYELQRFITSYGAPSTFTSDVTSLRPMLSGPVQLRLWVDTWAHAGSN